MPVQQTNSPFAGRLGAKLAEANAEHAGKPIDLGGRRQLPPDIRSGRAKLSTMYTKVNDKDEGGLCPKGEVFFRASAIVLEPPECAGAVTSFTVPLCDIAPVQKADYTKKGSTFSENWNKFRSLIEALGCAAFSEPGLPKTAPEGDKIAQGVRIEAYYMAAIQMLLAKKPPIEIEFSTRGFTPKATAAQPKPTTMVFEDWHGLWKGAITAPPAPGAGMRDNSANPPPPPTTNHLPVMTPAAAPPPVAAAPVQAADPADVVASLVEVCMNDPEGATAEMADASAQLEQMAWANGWSQEDTKEARDWAHVGDMALGAKSAAPVAAVPTVGSKHKFCKRTKDGVKLSDKTGSPFPPISVVVVTVDAAARTCTVSTEDNKPVVDIRTKAPVAVKFEWLE